MKTRYVAPAPEEWADICIEQAMRALQVSLEASQAAGYGAHVQGPLAQALKAAEEALAAVR